MGSGSSTQVINPNVRLATDINTELVNINQLHVNIDAIKQQILNEGAAIIAELEKRGYLNQESFCQRLAIEKADELGQFFPVQVLEGVSYRIGVMPDPNKNLELDKNALCRQIVEFHQEKVNIINRIRDEMPKCEISEGKLWTQLAQKLVQLGISDSDKRNIYAIIQQFDQEVQQDYYQIKANLDAIRVSQSVAELDSLVRGTDSLLARSNAVCLNYQRQILSYQYTTKSIIYPTLSGGEGLVDTKMLPKTYTALYDYQAQASDQLSLVAGDRVVGLDAVPREGWLYVAKRDGLTDQKGFVPSNYLREVV